MGTLLVPGVSVAILGGGRSRHPDHTHDSPMSQSACCRAAFTSEMGAPDASRSSLMRAIWLPPTAKHRTAGIQPCNATLGLGTRAKAHRSIVRRTTEVGAKARFDEN